MNTMDEIAGRLGAIEEKTKEVVADLEKLGSIQRSLEGSNKTLTAVNAHVTEIAQTARSTVDGLNDAVTAFQEAIEVIRRSDPQVVKNSLERFETENQRILTKLDAVDELTSEVRTLRALVEETAEKSDGNTRSAVEWAVERLGGQNLFDRMLGRAARS